MAKKRARYGIRRLIMPSLRVRRAAVLMWILVTIAVIAAVAAATAPLLLQINDTNRIAITARMLRDVARGVDSFNAVVKRGSGSTATNTTPASLDLLTVTVASGKPAGCRGQQYDSTSVNAWGASAPFAPYVMPAEGLSTPIGRLGNAPSRSTTTTGAQRRSASDPYFIQIGHVDVKMARLLDVYVDGAANANADTVLYTTPSRDSTVLLSYRVFLRTTPAC
jgi:hypothetical protein